MAMEQDSDQDMKQNQLQPPLQQHPPQKCPRCESLNTKFCYYNNYSLSQPRYFCKTCRRYWTQGGTLRNVPVGGGCRKGKRTKSSSSGENSRSQPQMSQQQALQQNLTSPQSMQSMISSNPMISVSSGLRTKESVSSASPSAISSVGSYYPSGGLPSLAAIQSLNQPQPFNQPLDQALSIGRGDLGDPSNLGLLQGYGVHSFGSHQHQSIQQNQFFQMANREKTVNMYPSDQIQSSRPADAGNSSQQNWHQGFINNTNPTVSEAAFWSINNSSSSTGTAGNTNSTNTTGVSSLNPNRWPNLPGYGAP